MAVIFVNRSAGWEMLSLVAVTKRALSGNRRRSKSLLIKKQTDQNTELGETWHVARLAAVASEGSGDEQFPR